jgi:predicted flap endonuclease-1-like 5' DNA nuclease
MTFPISHLDGRINAATQFKLKAVGIRTAEKLLEHAKSAKGRQELSERANIDAKELLQVANLIDRMRIKGVGPEYAELLEAAGVVTVNQLKFRSPAKLAKKLAEANAKRKLCRLLPSVPTVEQWIEQAKKLPIKISY